MGRSSFAHMNCPIARALDVIGEWWSLLIIAIGGAVLATAAILALAGEVVPATALVAILVPMMLLDATASICLLCVVRLQVRPPTGPRR